ncbi:hypothetical protein [Aquabacterium sp.]|uniref:hypothetical protein n=1 Tax=Aquabacterium sp. TaxID=1872578 RepID=UPI002BF3ABE6|nr:hypothetical protein [Aquabacterium sp.]HSW06799.1 hypothetical protein [Aquabacterium sp.]
MHARHAPSATLSANPSAAPTALSRRRLMGAIAQAAGLGALAACSWPAAAWQPGLASLEVFDRDSGQVMPIHHHQGRQFVPGRPGARYALRLRNNTGQRVLVVLSIDGVNVVSGETADWHQTGYVLDPGRSYDINGWRKSNTEVAGFEFAPIERSYAALTGRPGNVGVIGMAAFRERYVPPPQPPMPIAPPISQRREGAAADAAAPPAPAAPAQRSAQAGAMNESRAEGKIAAEQDSAGSRLGTGHGQREWSVTQRTQFQRASSTPEQVVQLEYDSLERLVAAGIVPAPQASHAYTRPRPFPSNQPGFVPDPPQR